MRLTSLRAAILLALSLTASGAALASGEGPLTGPGATPGANPFDALNPRSPGGGVAPGNVAFGAPIEATPAGAAVARIKDLVEFEGVRGNDLVGYGLVVGLDGSGDGLRNSPFTEEALANLLERLGVNVSGEQFRPRNVAAVLVTATLPPFARAGSRVDVTVSTIGDADSLLGGTLIMTPLNAADGAIYAVAQGSVIAGGARAGGDAASVTQGVPTAGTIPSGARVEREVEFALDDLRAVRLAVRDADFTTAARIEAAINTAFGAQVARMLDSGTVELNTAAMRGFTPSQALARIENLPVAPSQKARVVVDHRSGTIVLGNDVRVSRIAVSQGGLTLRVTETPLVSQPNPFSPGGETVVVPRTGAELVQENGVNLAIVDEAPTLAELVGGLNALGVSPRDMIDILKAIKAAGALHADFVVQ
jgi:flagellar P-ring protein precursor FlgI